MHKPDAAIAMIRDALAAGIPAEYILMDTWFTNEPFIKRILGCGLDVIGMLKNNRQMYHFNGGLYNLDSLAAYFARMNAAGDILGSVVVKTKREHIPVKLVFVRNRNNRSEYINPFHGLFPVRCGDHPQVWIQVVHRVLLQGQQVPAETRQGIPAREL